MIECTSCGKKYTEDEARGLKLLRATTDLKKEVVKCFCPCGAVITWETIRGIKAVFK